jgi:DNA-binding NarL/FixJ family response regulator
MPYSGLESTRTDSNANHFRIVIADSNFVFREGLRSLIEEEPDLVVVGTAENGLELLGLLDKLTLNDLTPHLVILDLSMPILRGFEALPLINKTHPTIDTLICTTYNEAEIARHAMALGARGYLLKEDSSSELLSAIEKIRQGESYISRSLSVPQEHPSV